MKYNVGIARKKPTNVVAVKSSKMMLLSMKNGTNTKAVNRRENANALLKPFGSLLVKDCPCLFKNILSSVYVTLLKVTNNLGKSNRVNNANNILSNISLIAMLKQIPSQNIIFQKLSLFNLSLSQFISALRFKVSSFKLSLFKKLLKQIIKWLMIIMIGCPQNMALAEDLEKLISSVEKEHNIPSGLLRAVVQVESGINAYALNIEGKTLVAQTREAASKIIRSYLKQGQTNIDIGVAQLNWKWHGGNFNSIEDMLIPANNVRYAALLLTNLYAKHGDWQKAVRFYHSAKPDRHRKYSRKVLIAWLGV